MTIRLRQIALVAKDLDAAVSAICQGFELSVCFNDPGVGSFGLHNALMRLGDDFLEVVSPTAEGSTAGRLLERRGGDGGYMVIVQADSFDELARLRGRLADLGVRIVWQNDYPDIAGTHLHPRDVGGAILSIDATDEPNAWHWGGPGWATAATGSMVSGLAGVTVGATDPAAMCERWAEVLDQKAEGTRIELDGGGFIDFVPAGERGEGVDGVTFRSADGRHRYGDLCGCRLELA